MVGMQRASAGSGVDLGLNGANSEVRQAYPFAPANLEGLFRGKAGFHLRQREKAREICRGLM